MDKDTCRLCYIRQVCFPRSIITEQREYFENHVLQATFKITKNTHLASFGETFTSLYMIKHGSFKKSLIQNDQRELIAAFYFQGEIIGFRASSHGSYSGNIIALEDSLICKIDYKSLMEMASTYPSFQQNILQAMSDRLSLQDSIILNATAKERVVAFLLEVFERIYAPQPKAIDALKGVFLLSMSRDEIGHYLGLNAETISRMLTELCQENLIETSGKHIELLDKEALYKLIDFPMLE